MHEFTYQINGQPLDPTAYIEWPERTANEFPEMQEVKIPVVSRSGMRSCCFQASAGMRRYLYACFAGYYPVCEHPVCSGLDSFVKDNGEITVEGDTTLYFDLGRVIKGTFKLEASFQPG